MSVKNIVVGAVSLGLGVSASLYTHPAEAQIASATQEEEACRSALEQNTIEAIEDFLARFPTGSSACRALARSALASFNTDNAVITQQFARGAGGGRGDGQYGGV
jgi:hypothetical protein